MKICYVGKFKNSNATERAVSKALKHFGHQVIPFDYTDPKSDSNLFEMSKTEHFELYLFSKSQDISLRTIKSIQSKKIMWIFDGLRINSSKSIRQDSRNWIIRAKCMDAFFTAAACDVSYYRKIGIDAQFLPQACDKRIYKKYDTPKDIELVFVGNQYGNYRSNILRKIYSKHKTLKVYGNGWSSIPSEGARYGIEVAKIYSRSKIVIGMGEIPGIIDQWSNRVWNAMGCGTVLLHKYCPGFKNFFENGKTLVWWKNEQELMNLITELLNDQVLRENISMQSYNLVHDKHTYEKRVASLFL